MKRSLICLAIAFLGGWFGHEASALEFPNPANRLGFAGEDGRLNIWCNFDDDLKLNGKHSIPMRLHFGGNQNRFSESSLGFGWWAPFMESAVYEESERALRMTQLGGNDLFLLRNPENLNQYYSKGRDWVANLDGRNLVVEGKNGWTYRYENGRLDSAKTPWDDFLKWSYSGKRVTEISSRMKGVLLDASYNPEGMLEKISYNGGEDWLQFEYEKIPVVAKAFDGLVVTDLKQSMRKITSSSGYEGIFDITVDREKATGDYQLALSETADAGAEAVQSQFGWDSNTGLLNFDPHGRYDMDFSSPNQKYPKITLHRKGGGQDTYFYDPKTMIREIENFREKFVRKTRIQFIGTEGPSFAKVRKVEAWNGKDWIKERLHFYDPSGRILRSINHGSEFLYEWGDFEGKAGEIGEYFYGQMNGQSFRRKTIRGLPKLIEITTAKPSAKPTGESKKP